MKERPILFSSNMVRALLEGRKTQTRRLIKPQPDAPRTIYNILGSDTVVTPIIRDGSLFSHGKTFVDFHYKMTEINGIPTELMDLVRGSECPYGKIGDRLWVRETWQAYKQTSVEYDEWEVAEKIADVYGHEYDYVYRADNEIFPEKWFPSIYMPWFASRITLEITNIRVEKIQDINDMQALEEGVEHELDDLCPAYAHHFKDYSSGVFDLDARGSFRTLWDSINKEKGFGWDENPWVWVISFRRVEG